MDVKAAGAIIYYLERGKPLYLLLRSAKHGEWGAPKGHSDTGETEMETAIREIFEETGIRRLSFQPGFREALRYEVRKKGQLFHKESVYFLAQTEPDVEVHLSHEHTEAHMATIDEVDVLLNHEDLKEVFHKADAFIVTGHALKHV
ncbi:MAG TPA: NUDIX domain-containing protein [Planctomycetota bacterium]|nr:NUDIX domain-containing protein [Planctomycetota bacterium]